MDLLDIYWALALWLLRTTGMHVVAMETHALSYGAIIDAGSSGSRIRLFQWMPRTSWDKLPTFKEFHSVKVEPGISWYMDDLDGLRPYLRDMIKSAEDKIPEHEYHRTPVFLMATAGMRLLLEPKANDIMEQIQTLLADPELCPFQFQEQQARILSGEEEGVFGWIAANYLNNYFHDTSGRESAGILELGGASTQIAFIPEGSILADKFPVRLAGKTYPLYVHSYLYYGQNFAELWVKEYLHREQPTTTIIDNPCMLRGDSTVDVISGTAITFHGIGQPSTCAGLVEKLVFKVEPYHCYPKPCAVGQVYQPTISSDKQFYALSAFTYPLRTLEVLDDEGRFTPLQAYNSAMQYCQKHIDAVIEETGRKRDFLSVECLMGIYIPILFTRGYGFTNDTRQVAAKFDINGQPAEWPLGAIIYETERHVSTRCVKSASSTSSSVHLTYSMTSLMLLCLLSILNSLSLITFHKSKSRSYV